MKFKLIDLNMTDKEEEVFDFVRMYTGVIILTCMMMFGGLR